jgi:23S rRNA (adenine2503-C2)-methyltransferase
MPKLDVKSMSYDEIAALMTEWGEKPFRGSQLFEWLHRKQISDFSEITTFSKALRDKCIQQCYISSVTIKKRLVSAHDDTVKYLYELADGHCVETVLMRYRHGSSLCVSTQAGCRMGCGFCASTQTGFVRNLTPAEMLGQVYESARDSDSKISNVVLMGVGEPLDNFDNVIRFLELLSHPKGLNLSLRHVSLSTCGLVDQIEKLAGLKLGLTLSVSLHAVTDDERNELMPVNRRFGIAGLIAACRRYYKKTGRRISFEYALIKGKNDTLYHADKLSALLRGFPSHVNLIPVNPVLGLPYKKTSMPEVQEFLGTLERHGIAATVRRELGSDINAACGQLRAIDNVQLTMNESASGRINGGQ